MRPARAPGRAGGRPVRPRGRERCVCVLAVAAARRREDLGGTHPATRRGSAAWRPPRTHPPRTGHPGVVT
eukprot:6544454-Prymnesium_polylepis.1